MEKLTYKQAYNKIIEAYFKDEIKPADSNFCFCGTLSPTKGKWNEGTVGFSWGEIKPEYLTHRYNHYQPYTLAEYKKMEWALINTKNRTHGTKEDRLFAGMCAALEVLKNIHRERGENVDEEIPFKKRELVKVNA